MPRVTHRYHSSHEQPPQATRIVVAARSAAGRARGAGVWSPAPRSGHREGRRSPHRARARLAADRLGQCARPVALPAVVLAARGVRHAAAGRSRLWRAPATGVRVLGSRGVAVTGRVPAIAALAHAAREERRRHLGQRRAIRARPCRLLRRGARGNSRSRPARRVRDRHRRPPQGQLVGLERRQDSARVAVLDRTGHHAFAATLRARV